LAHPVKYTALSGFLRLKQKQALLFVNKKKQKNFINFAFGPFQQRAKRSKSFLVLFFKKELLVLTHFLGFADGLVVTFFVHKKEDSSFPKSLHPLYTPAPHFPSHLYAVARKHRLLKGRCPMGDIISIVFGCAIFIALILYVPACEAV
jgi:hypothetical protein